MYNLCCISNELKADGYSFRTMTWKRYLDLASESESDALFELGERWYNNVYVTRKTIKHCAKNGWGYRVSSSLIPLLTHPQLNHNLEEIPQYNEIQEIFDDIRQNDSWGVRLSTHPDQFNVLASENSDSVERTINELNHHGWLMDELGCHRNHYNPINIHINCSKGEPSDIAARFWDNLERCEENVTQRLVVENEDKGVWNVQNLITYVHSPYDIPITYDNLHDECNPSPELEDPMTLCDATWDCKPLFHYSESHPDKKNPRSHCDIPVDIPPSEGYDWDIECKAKDRAIRTLGLNELTQLSQEMGFYEQISTIYDSSFRVYVCILLYTHRNTQT